MDPDSISPDYLFDPGPVTTGVVLLATVLFELTRLSAAVDKLEHERQARQRSVANRQAAALAAGRPLRPVGRPRKVS